jgi:site-specific recombinase XerD
MHTMLSISFYLHRKREDAKKHVPIIIRIKLHGLKRDISSGLRIHPDQWNAKFGAAKGNSESAKQTNQLLGVSKSKLLQIFTRLSYGGDVSIAEIITEYHGKAQPKSYNLLKVVAEHKDHITKRLGIDYTESTIEKYKAMELRITQYVTEHLKVKDVPLKSLDRKFIANFFLYLKEAHKNQHNSATKTTKNLKRVLAYAVEQGYIEQNPFQGFKCGYKETVRTVLTMEELQRIEQKPFTIPRLALVKDLFLFQCYTGLSFVDMAALKWRCVVKASDDIFWLEIVRRKTAAITQIPLFPVALQIVGKYNKNKGEYKPDDTLLPGCHIQKANSYLKEIADLCGINKNLSTHSGRRTFASTVMLNNGVRIEAVSRMLAHSSIRVTQLYAKVYDQHLIEQTKHISWLWGKEGA